LFTHRFIQNQLRIYRRDRAKGFKKGKLRIHWWTQEYGSPPANEGWLPLRVVPLKETSLGVGPFWWSTAKDKHIKFVHRNEVSLSINILTPKKSQEKKRTFNEDSQDKKKRPRGKRHRYVKNPILRMQAQRTPEITKFVNNALSL
jgi:hypothetical protein